MQLQKDSEGNILTVPVIAWGITPVAEASSLILTIQYAETLQELERGEVKQLQMQMTTQKALELAEELRKATSVILASGHQVH